jgi:SAM-dependent methyltransferase
MTPQERQWTDEQAREFLKRTFNEIAALYDSVRPGYPAQLVTDLINLSNLRPGGTILEVGCGTGQLTRPLAERGYEIVALEPGNHLVALAHENLAHLSNARVVNSSFEDWDGPSHLFDLVVAATSWHWLDPATRFAKAAESLVPGGHLGIVTTEHAFPEDADSFFAVIQETYEAIGEGSEEGWPPPHPDDVPDQSAEIDASGYFRVSEVRRYLWSATYEIEEYIRLLDTYSNHRRMTESQRRHLHQDIRTQTATRGQTHIKKHYLNFLHVAAVAR